jgi:GntR family transcriptional regulator
MFIRLETSSGMPITRQIADQIRAACASGSLASGDRLPSVRQLAQELAVNQNTILRVYERLTAEGLLERRHGDGTYVADHLPAGQLTAQRELLRQEVVRLAQRAHTLGVEPQQVHKLLDEAIHQLQTPAVAVATSSTSTVSRGGQHD